ncbi:MAG: hypothetical protein OH338_04390 [Candidatus Parvarchaeota archaeon]|nr:hypothetical protein [Candidatus Parvarchaeota archaeon]MCW1294301.1 hypothetical protein [Candidatus Parvarchaeum tengchongense]MCW1295363.1 hypothetical protein [Candidatus Parvarchaeum tengchongense]MCW1299568.1 hypothetical protein [Candidatus Parvarchaeum tengchongense]MCW1312636.1 hypothetical protein [Candidatus Parvarchaeum tengchongense]
MVKNQENERLEELLFDCSLTFFGKPNLDVFSRANDLKSNLGADSLVYSSSYKVLNPETVAIDLHFYTISNKYELKNKLNNLADQYSFGLSYRIHELKE